MSRAKTATVAWKLGPAKLFVVRGGRSEMNDYIFLMHGDGAASADDAWGPYLERLKASGQFRGGSSIGAGACLNKAGKAVATSDHLVGYITVQAEDLQKARELVAGNPVYEAGGTVEIRELPRS
jgi:hypothetical protein